MDDFTLQDPTDSLNDPGAASTTAPAARVEPGILRSRAPRAPSTRRPEHWLEWMADQPTADAIDAAIEADMHHSIIAYAVGKWIAEYRTDELAAIIAADFERLGVGR